MAGAVTAAATPLPPMPTAAAPLAGTAGAALPPLTAMKTAGLKPAAAPTAVAAAMAPTTATPSPPMPAAVAKLPSPAAAGTSVLPPPPSTLMAGGATTPQLHTVKTPSPPLPLPPPPATLAAARPAAPPAKALLGTTSTTATAGKAPLAPFASVRPGAPLPAVGSARPLYGAPLATVGSARPLPAMPSATRLAPGPSGAPARPLGTAVRPGAAPLPSAHSAKPLTAVPSARPVPRPAVIPVQAPAPAPAMAMAPLAAVPTPISNVAVVLPAVVPDEPTAAGPPLQSRSDESLMSVEAPASHDAMDITLSSSSSSTEVAAVAPVNLPAPAPALVPTAVGVREEPVTPLVVAPGRESGDVKIPEDYVHRYVPWPCLMLPSVVLTRGLVRGGWVMAQLGRRERARRVAEQAAKVCAAVGAGGRSLSGAAEAGGLQPTPHLWRRPAARHGRYVPVPPPRTCVRGNLTRRGLVWSSTAIFGRRKR
jgi:hypothetical protein